MRAEQGFKLLPLLAFSLSFTAGIWLASVLIEPVALWLGLAGAGFVLSVLLLVVCQRRPDHSPASGILGLPLSPVLAGLCLVSLFLGAARFQTSQPSFTDEDLAWYNGAAQAVELVGWAVEPPDVR
jgi:hypothetical protein